MSRKRKQAED